MQASARGLAAGLLAMQRRVGELRFVSAARDKALSRLGIETMRDLLLNAPLRYIDFTEIAPIASCRVGEQATVAGRVDDVSVRAARRGMRIVKAYVVDASGVVEAVWFNQPWVAEQLPAGSTVVLQGGVGHNAGYKQMRSPRFLVVGTAGTGSAGSAGEGGSAARGASSGAGASPAREGRGRAGQGQKAPARRSAPAMVPVYRQTKGLTTAWISRFAKEALAEVGRIADPIPAKLRAERDLMSKSCAVRALHFPRCADEAEQARRRLAYEELLLLQLHWAEERRADQERGDSTSHVVGGPAMRAYESALPFDLTEDQRRALAEILEDMAAPRRMNRLLLGDVGTGKTVVAAGAMAAAADSAGQSVLMAPTEVLARQYGDKIGGLLDSMGIHWAVLTSSTDAAERARTLSGLADGSVGALFSTHAALEDDVRFSRLTLVVVDEQHRFGVEQRERLRAKGPASDYLCMTATPIPRSLAMVVYGNLDCSYIRQRPGDRPDVQTAVYAKENRFLAFDAIREAVAGGHQAYIICPLVGEKAKGEGKAGSRGSGKAGSPRREAGEYRGGGRAAFDLAGPDEADLAPTTLGEEELELAGSDLKAARSEARYLQEEVFTTMNVGLLCGKMSAAEKAEAFEAFRDGRTDVLVSTTVVEVGVDVPNATVMVIEDAERFGLSQLHQLRGRVGRGECPGKVILLADPADELSQARMDAFASTNDGFELASLDLELRREGDIIGRRQHGMPSLRFSDVAHDGDLIALCRRDAASIAERDPGYAMPENALLAYELGLSYPAGAAGRGAAGGRHTAAGRGTAGKRRQGDG